MSNCDFTTSVSKISKIVCLTALSLAALFIFIRITNHHESDSFPTQRFSENSTTGESIRKDQSTKKNSAAYNKFKFQGNKFWRPEKANSERSFDFDASFDDRILEQRRWMKNLTKSSIFKKLKTKRILLEKDFIDISGQVGCEDGETPLWNKKCIVEIDKNFGIRNFEYPKNIEDYDVVIEFRNYGLPKKERLLGVGSKVKQFLFALESPYVTGSYDLSLNNAFLGTYWRGSDITVPYCKWIPFINKDLRRQAHHVQSKSRNYAAGRTKLAAIVVTNCDPANNRLGYVRELQRHVPVDTYGKCGNLNCTEPCFQNLKRDYKFYLAFENANCRDYITEKLFRNSLGNEMVPVVMGAEKKDYVSIVPPHSFIHVEDFESPFELAQFLKHLDQNDNLYNKYFEWKSEGNMQTWFQSDFICRACGLLFMADFVPPPVWPKGSSWAPESQCAPRGNWYWHRPNK